jgi:hypothetical protein
VGDERLRELERRWRASGSTDDEAAWLVERVRLGRLREERLLLAAELEHRAATLACQELATRVVVPPADGPGGFEEEAWLLVLARHGPEALLELLNAFRASAPRQASIDALVRRAPDVSAEEVAQELAAALWLTTTAGEASSDGGAAAWDDAWARISAAIRTRLTAWALR